jgi:protein gp37
MADQSKIEWTTATWNPLVGCSILSRGCKRCYAMKDAWRLMHNPNAKVAAKFAGTAQVVNGRPVWTGRINVDETTLLAPLKRRVPTTYFVNSMSDLFHEDVADETIDRVFAVMALCPHHKFQVLTKRSARMQAYFAERWQGTPARQIDCGSAGIISVPAGGPTGRRHQVEGACEELITDLGLDDTSNEALWTAEGSLKLSQWQWPLPNVWLGVSVEDQASCDRVVDLAQTPAVVRFISGEPLLEAVSLIDIPLNGGADEHGIEWLFNALTGEQYFVGDDGFTYNGDGPGMEPLDWVIVGGESGHRARPMHPNWARSLRDQCAAVSVPFFFKQWGHWLPRGQHDAEGYSWPDLEFPSSAFAHTEIASHGAVFAGLGKKAAGRSLDSLQHDGMPA